jgi:hypothetical protein
MREPTFGCSGNHAFWSPSHEEPEFWNISWPHRHTSAVSQKNPASLAANRQNAKVTLVIFTEITHSLESD